MATLNVLPIWNFLRLGTGSPIARLTVDDDGPLVNVDFSTGRYCNVDCSAITKGATAFKDALKTALDAASSGAGVYTVTFSTSTLKYTIAYSAGTFTLGFPLTVPGGVMRTILGFSGTSYSGSSSYTGENVALYALRAFGNVKSNDSDEYDDEDGTRVEPAADGKSVYSISPLSVGKQQDWELQFEEFAPTSSSGVFTRNATATWPLTWQDFYELRNVEPFLVTDDSLSPAISSLHYLTQEGVDFKVDRRRRAWSNYSKKWHIVLRTYLLGRL